MTRPVPLPPEPFDPVEDTVDAGAELLRVYVPGGSQRTPAQFNPGTSLAIRLTREGDAFPVSRYSFFLDDGEPRAPVPALYASPSANVVLWETVLRNRAPDDETPVTRAEYRGLVLARLRTARPLRVVSLAGSDMTRLKLPAETLTEPGVDRYTETIPWARAAWRAGFDGIRYVSRRDPSGLAFVFFDRPQRGHMFAPSTPEDQLCAFDDLSEGGGFEWLAMRLSRWGIVAAV